MALPLGGGVKNNKEARVEFTLEGKRQKRSVRTEPLQQVKFTCLTRDFGVMGVWISAGGESARLKTRLGGGWSKE